MFHSCAFYPFIIFLKMMILQYNNFGHFMEHNQEGNMKIENIMNGVFYIHYFDTEKVQNILELHYIYFGPFLKLQRDPQIIIFLFDYYLFVGVDVPMED